jgi:hypothetical protein
MRQTEVVRETDCEASAASASPENVDLVAQREGVVAAVAVNVIRGTPAR